MGLLDVFKKNVNVENFETKDFELTYEQANPITKSIITQLGYPCRIFSSKADYEYVMDVYQQAVVQGEKEGFTPLLIPSDDVLDEYFGILKDDGYSLKDILKCEVQSGKELLENLFKENTDGGIDEFDMEEFIGEFDYEPTGIKRYTAFAEQEILLLNVPTTKPWELVAYVPFGGWNDCPDVEKMMAICKHWYEKYGAVPVTISHDVMEMRVPQPVKQEEALQVAKEHFAFTPDRVYQCTGTGTLSEVAKCIANSEIWYFWWD